jgi:hypothetical protein
LSSSALMTLPATEQHSMTTPLPHFIALLAGVLLIATSAEAQDTTGKEIVARVTQRPLTGGGAVPSGAIARPAPITAGEKLPQRQVTPLPQVVLVPGGKFNPSAQKFYAWRYKAEDSPALAIVWSVPPAAVIYFPPGELAQAPSPVIDRKLPALRPEEPKIAPTANPVETEAFSYTIARANAPLPPTPFSPGGVPDPFKNTREVQLRQPPPDLEGPSWITGSPPAPIKLPVPEEPAKPKP